MILFISPSAGADRLITEDGRIISLVKARAEEDGYRLTFEHGEFFAGPDAGIASVEIEGDMSDYVPQNDDEREKLAKGFVRHNGKWMSKPRYETELKKAFLESKKRTDNLAAHSDWENCWTLETKHFLVKSNTSEELLQYYGDLLEAYYKLMDNRVGIKPTPSYRRIKMTVNIYKSRKEFQDFSASDVGPSTLGYFWSYDNTLNFFHDYEEPARSEWVALHECTHLLTFLIDQQYGAQIWLNEAMADYFGSSSIARDKRGKIVIEPGELQTDRILTVQEAIRAENDTKLKKLFFIKRANFTGFHYAHGWSFVYFLFNVEDGKHAKAFTKCFKDIYTLKKGIPFTSKPGPGPTGTEKRVSAADIRDLLMKAIKYDDLEKLEHDWKAYIASIPIDSGPALLKRGLNRTRRGEFTEAIEDLDSAIEQGITDPRAWSSRGLSKAFTGNMKEAIEDLETAAQRAPLNANIRYRLSQLKVGLASMGSASFQRGKSDQTFDNEEAKSQAGLAMELDPDNDAYKHWYEQFQ
ncbi:MAG: tetratricopeptide (TPR) repeat protein [Planctomycetota bacterium]|jgi:tetratricopeptide (TPR) repeat protein